MIIRSTAGGNEPFLYPMKIAVIGSGAIGCLVAGYLKLKNQDVLLTGHPESIRRIKERGLKISGVRGNSDISIEAAEKLEVKADLVILAVKTQDIEKAVKDNLSFLKDALILTTQNGIQADSLVSQFLPQENIISSIVMFGSTSLAPGEVVHNFEGGWILGRIWGKPDENTIKIKRLLDTIFPVIVADDIKAMKYLKVFVNANNCIPAILGLSMQEAFAEPLISGIAIGIWKEGLDIVSKAGVHLEDLPDFPLSRITGLTSMPVPEAAKIFSGIMSSLSKEPLYGSILQSIKRGKSSEIDYINGEFVNLAKKHNLNAPLNEKLVELVHQVERDKRFLSKEKLLTAVHGLVN